MIKKIQIAGLLVICLILTGCQLSTFCTEGQNFSSSSGLFSKKETQSTPANPQLDAEESTSEKTPQLYLPISNFKTGALFKHYGTFITPETSPVQPERFRGFHTGVDIEIAEENQNQEIPIIAIADGTVKSASYVNGYGGVVTILHTIDNADYIALYGHLNPNAFQVKTGQEVKAGQILGILGKGFSDETDNERMHLHLAITRGTSVDLRGYVQSESELSKWINPEEFLQNLNASFINLLEEDLQ